MNKRLLVRFSLLALGFSSLVAVSSEDKVTLKSVMQGLLKSHLEVTEAIVLQDFETIQVAAHNIAHHPKPGMGTKMKLVANLGTEMAKFKSYDDVVHNAAVDLEKSAKDKNMDLVLQNYGKILQGCQACHGQYKQRVSDILK